MKLEALILRALCAGSMLVCVLVLGNMLLATPAMTGTIGVLASTSQCATTANGLPNQPVVTKRERS